MCACDETHTRQRRSQNSAGSGQPPPVPYGVFLTLLLRISERLFTPAWMTDDVQRVGMAMGRVIQTA